MRRRSALVVLGLVAGLMVSPVVPQALAEQPRVNWQECPSEFGSDFDCAAYAVPLDHDQPGGTTIRLKLIRLPASDPAHKLGSIFINPGGPGGSGVDAVGQLGPILFSAKVRARFDLVGFDPRGIGRSNPLLCFNSFPDSTRVVPPFPFPATDTEENLVERLDMNFARACDARGRPILDHMATADVARDMDLLRAAVGDETLNYVGYSYGSFLGTTYANLFPQRVGALVVDAVLDPIAWTTGRGREAQTQPVSTRLRSDEGAQSTLDEFFRLCDEAGRDGCAYAPHSQTRYAALAALLRIAPVAYIDPFSGAPLLVRYADFIGITLSALYDPFVWPQLGRWLTGLEKAAVLAGGSQPAEDSATTSAPQLGLYRNIVEGFPGVICSDSVNPGDHRFWERAGQRADAQFGYFGRIWTWASSPCATWPGSDADRYLGPFTRETANPVLVVGNLYDPATRYQGAQTVADLLPNSALLTVAGWGHTSLFLSRCADDVVSQYLLTGATPAPGTVCQQDVPPFPSSSVTDQVLVDRQEARAKALEQIGPVRY